MVTSEPIAQSVSFIARLWLIARSYLCCIHKCTQWSDTLPIGEGGAGSVRTANLRRFCSWCKNDWSAKINQLGENCHTAASQTFSMQLLLVWKISWPAVLKLPLLRTALPGGSHCRPFSSCCCRLPFDAVPTSQGAWPRTHPVRSGLQPSALPSPVHSLWDQVYNPQLCLAPYTACEFRFTTLSFAWPGTQPVSSGLQPSALPGPVHSLWVQVYNPQLCPDGKEVLTDSQQWPQPARWPRHPPCNSVSSFSWIGRLRVGERGALPRWTILLTAPCGVQWRWMAVRHLPTSRPTNSCRAGPRVQRWRRLQCHSLCPYTLLHMETQKGNERQGTPAVTAASHSHSHSTKSFSQLLHCTKSFSQPLHCTKSFSQRQD